MTDPIYTVSELSSEIRRLLEADYGSIWIVGEISNLATPTSGHVYFTLKDERAQVRCALFRNRRLQLRVAIENGLSVHLKGKISLYEARGEFQIIVDYLELAGEGILRQRFEELKQKLHLEGLFEVANRTPIPNIPRKIGVITSPTGAAIRDILTTLRRRFPLGHVLIYPVAVQGSQAAPQISQALSLANKEPICDVIILSRGGGTLEDLWAFNEESVVRAISQSAIPIVTGIGHEIDITLSDLAADSRAATPTAAAETVSPNSNELINEVARCQNILRNIVTNSVQNKTQHVDLIATNLRHPAARFNAYRQQLTNLNARAIFRFQTRYRDRRISSLNLHQRLQVKSPHAQVRTNYLVLSNQIQHLNRLYQNIMIQSSREISSLKSQIYALSPSHTLDRGYAILRTMRGKTIVKDLHSVESGQSLEAELAHGWLECKVVKKRLKTTDTI